MKNIFYCLLFAATLLSSCQDKAPASTNTVVLAPETTETRSGGKPQTKTTCYEKREGKDISAIELTLVGDEASGFMAWEPHEKDGARGMFKGKKEGEMISATFTYMIEGSIQTEEVVFKISGDKLLQGQGELDDKSGRLLIKDKSKLTWNDTFNNVDCATVQESIRRAVDMHGMILKEQGQGQ